MAEKLNVLLAIDGSDQSLAAVHYVAGILSPRKTRITLFHVRSEIPETFLDQEDDDQDEFQDESYNASVREWSEQVARNMQKLMNERAAVFSEAGFDASSVETLIEPRKAGYARDILNKSRQGYAALVVGRKGFGALGDLMMGSIAEKLVETVKHIPLAVVGGQPETRNCLIAFDRSQKAMKGVECVSSMFDAAKVNVLLCHIVRPLNIPASGIPELFKKSQEGSWVDANTRKIVPAMVDAKRVLMRGGIEESRFSTMILKEKASRAESLYSEMRSFKAGTIVMGRRGLSKVEEFSMGRVSRKLLHLAVDKAVWII
jgi:nucleotide-binding universal stress UspA family protein